MKKKNSTTFVCQQCGYHSPKWMGQCPECGEWNSFVEHTTTPEVQQKSVSVPSGLVEPLSKVSMLPDQFKSRVSTGFAEFDRVLGTSQTKENTYRSGLVPGSVVLIAGEPGIGKSTLVTQTIVKMLISQENNVDEKGGLGDDLVKNKRFFILYANGEENSAQIAERVERIYKNYSKTSKKLHRENTLEEGWKDQLLFAPTSNVDQICSIIRDHTPSLVIIDSIQTMRTEDLSGTAGSFGQLKESTQRITETVKSLGIPTILIGHVTKEGVVAGPKVLEHIVDGVFELSGERTGEVRILRAIKNRFGATDEVGLFLMEEQGLKELSNPSQLFLQESHLKVPGSSVVCVMEGTRPLLLETQSLVIDSQLAIPRRIAQGIAIPRLQLIAAVLQKHARIPLGTSDLFVNIAGGFQVREPAADLGIAMAIVSSQKNIAIPKDTVFIGEVGLLGEIRDVSYLKRRIKEATRLGFKQIISRETHAHISQVVKSIFTSA